MLDPFQKFYHIYMHIHLGRSHTLTPSYPWDDIICKIITLNIEADKQLKPVIQIPMRGHTTDNLCIIVPGWGYRNLSLRGVSVIMNNIILIFQSNMYFFGNVPFHLCRWYSVLNRACQVQGSPICDAHRCPILVFLLRPIVGDGYQYRRSWILRKQIYF